MGKDDKYSKELEVLEARRKELVEKFEAGETYTLKELMDVIAAEKLLGREVPDSFDAAAEKRKYTLSPEAIEARRQNAQKSTGPTSPLGKFASSRNARKHGRTAEKLINRIVKPCLSTCPAFEECVYIKDDKTGPGGDCLENEYFIGTLSAVEQALRTKELTGDFQGIMAFELARGLDTIPEMQDAVKKHGALVESYKTDANGNVTGIELKLNPVLTSLPKLLDAFGVNLSDWLLTPHAIAKVKANDKAAESVATILSNITGKVTTGPDAA